MDELTKRLLTGGAILLLVFFFLLYGREQHGDSSSLSDNDMRTVEELERATERNPNDDTAFNNWGVCT